MKDKYHACLVCRTEFDIAHGGINSVKVHESELSELSCRKQTVLNFSRSSKGDISVRQSGSSLETGTGLPDQKCSVPEIIAHLVDRTLASSENGSVFEVLQQSSSSSFLLRDEVTKAEIIWALHKIMSHSSSRNGGASIDLFPLMFSYSMVAQKFQMQKHKLFYVVTYGLGLFLQCSFANKVKLCEFFAIPFDESPNKML
ncbi:hypothetical protein PR048_005888 [Dryococelus australis]|uniref:Uncharacterized protein n=1 Tax=Dryococelus australis TaxID=614101 RepID=A0ABQ9I9F4_9NEOP|nr:hypothetical protein PR048_005888 [Dryococelus australis]